MQTIHPTGITMSSSINEGRGSHYTSQFTCWEYAEEWNEQKIAYGQTTGNCFMGCIFYGKGYSFKQG